ncbi:MAG: hypothetical protein HND44_22930 [Chloroflexi bacterium]|nr:hypothetical protein [Ardenticatenaceae bacterium]NOG37397.1 hypothetical protein [Chloroflexota bacterium]GIK55251.1 MAG: hypothetical protein BroJett015_09140 [Chloroflexota bacterium]
MDTQIIVAIVTGLFSAVITPLTAQVIIPAFKSSPIESKPKRPLLTFLQAGVGGIAGVLLGYFLLSPFFVSPCPPFASTRVDITSPVSGTSVPRLVTVQGTACHIPNGKELWLFVVPEGVTAYYPQTGPVVISSDGNWSASAYAGLDDPIDIGKGFILIAALADQQGSAAIRGYFAQSGSEFKGLEPLPQGIQIMAQVRVIRK